LTGDKNKKRNLLMDLKDKQSSINKIR
jgi:hypothetical protein